MMRTIAAQLLDEVERDRALKGLVITGKDPLNFAAGADIDAIESVTDPEVVRKFVRTVQDPAARGQVGSPHVLGEVGELRRHHPEQSRYQRAFPELSHTALRCWLNHNPG